MRVGRAVTDVVNVSRSGVLIRTSCGLDAAGEWPVILEFNSVLVRVAARVVRKEEEAAGYRAGSNQCLVGLTFIKPSPSVQAVLDDVCGVDRDAAARGRKRPGVRWPTVSFTRCCPNCHSANIDKQKRRHYECLDCGRRFVGLRIANLRIAI
jgi:hypothetical protein